MAEVNGNMDVGVDLMQPDIRLIVLFKAVLFKTRVKRNKENVRLP